jgi:hypothetical protein
MTRFGGFSFARGNSSALPELHIGCAQNMASVQAAVQ